MTKDNPTPERPAGPTPEEIGARLEALLKRTHALRQAQMSRPADAADKVPSWPPSDFDMEAVEVLDVPAGRAVSPAPPSRKTAPADDRPDEATPERDFGRPDWSTLRLRDNVVEPPVTPPWVWLVIAALVVALGLETAYLMRTRPWATAAATGPVAVSIEGQPGLLVRVNGEAARALPFTQEVSGPDLRLAIETAESAAAAAAAAAATTDGAQPADADASAASTTATTPPAAAAPVAPTEQPTATTGVVVIESTPPGVMVTMEGRERGVTPITIGRLRPGRHDVMVEDARGRRFFKVDVAAGQVSRLDTSGPSRP